MTQSPRPPAPPRVPRQSPRPPVNSDYKDVNGSPSVIDSIVDTLITIVSWPFLFLAAFLETFVARGGKGMRLLGVIAFFVGVLFGTDNYYQMLTGNALLPWFTRADWIGDIAKRELPRVLRWSLNLWGGETVIGWGSVLLAMLSIGFFISLSFSLLTQFVQGRAVRGKQLDKARADFNFWGKQTLPNKPDENKTLDMATTTWKDLKRSGKGSRRFVGIIALGLWGIEIVSAFSAHNPLNYIGQAGLFIGCTCYALVTVVAGEVGYAIYCEAKEESAMNS